MDWKLELVVVPVTDVDRAKSFYMEQSGFELLVDHRNGDFRVVQLSPPGSACAIALMPEGDMPAGSLRGLHLVVTDIVEARKAMLERGGPASELFHFDAGAPQPGADPNRGDYQTFFTFADPDGNAWMVQEVPGRAA